MAKRPNILFLMTDHTGAQATAPGSACLTPNLDALAMEGVRFGRAYTPNAICSPARASLMTGLYPSTHGMWDCTHTQRPAWVDVVLRTAMYSLGVAVVLVLEKGFEGRHEHGGFGPALRFLFQEADVYHVWANTLCLSGALLVYNALSVVQRHLGKGSLIRIFMSPMTRWKIITFAVTVRADLSTRA